MNFDGIDHLELYVGDLDAAAELFCAGFGFRVTCRSVPESGQPHGRESLLLEQGRILLVLTRPGSDTDEAADFLAVHGDGIKDVAFRTPDAVAAFEEAVRRGASVVHAPRVYEGPHGRLVRATVASPVGDLVHSFIQRETPVADFWPGRFPLREVPTASTPLVAVDHLALCLLPGSLQETVDAYARLLGFHESHEENVETRYGGMTSKVVQDASGRVCFAMMAPMPGKRPGQIDHFLAHHRGAGVQHLAFLSEDILAAVDLLRARRVPLLDSPRGYHDALPARVGTLAEDLSALRAGHVLVDREGETGYLLQVFTRSVHDRGTLFFELIQRKQAHGFGTANIRALYQSVEQEMMRQERPAAECG